VTGKSAAETLVRLGRRLPVWPYLLLTLPMFVVALILRAITRSDLPYQIWAVLWAIPLLIVLSARWLYFVVTLAWAIVTAIVRAVRRRFARPG
jgi:hypothetical protein